MHKITQTGHDGDSLSQIQKQRFLLSRPKYFINICGVCTEPIVMNV